MFIVNVLSAILLGQHTHFSRTKMYLSVFWGSCVLDKSWATTQTSKHLIFILSISFHKLLASPKQLLFSASLFNLKIIYISLDPYNMYNIVLRACPTIHFFKLLLVSLSHNPSSNLSSSWRLRKPLISLKLVVYCVFCVFFCCLQT